MIPYVLKLYVMGQSPRSARALRNLRETCESVIPGRYELIVIDVLEMPHLAEEHKIFATPTLVKETPLPVRKIIGDLSDRESLMLGLDLGDPWDTSAGAGEP